MNEWIVGVEKAATRMQPGASLEEVRRAETEAGYEMPVELCALYSRINGGDFEGQVHLFPLHDTPESEGVVEKSRKKLVGLPAAGIWRIGHKGDHRHLFAARRGVLGEQAEDTHWPSWAEQLGAEAWVYGAWDEEKDELRLYRTLGQMMEVMVPPAQTEEFGDLTYARALSAVEQALETVKGAAGGVVPAARGKKAGKKRAVAPIAEAPPLPERHLPSAQDMGLTPGEATPMPVEPEPIPLAGLTPGRARAKAKRAIAGAAAALMGTAAAVRKRAAKKAAGTGAKKAAGRAPARAPARAAGKGARGTVERAMPARAPAAKAPAGRGAAAKKPAGRGGVAMKGAGARPTAPAAKKAAAKRGTAAKKTLRTAGRVTGKLAGGTRTVRTVAVGRAKGPRKAARGTAAPRGRGR